MNSKYSVLGHAKNKAKYHIGNAYYQRNVKDDISLYVRAMKRKLRGRFTDDFMEVKLYYNTQAKIFRHIKKIKKRPSMDSREPGSTSFNKAGIYNGLSWVLLCIGAAMNFNDDTKASTLYSYV